MQIRRYILKSNWSLFVKIHFDILLGYLGYDHKALVSFTRFSTIFEKQHKISGIPINDPVGLKWLKDKYI